MRLTAKILTYTVGFLFAASALLALAAGWRMSQGPVRVSFLTPWLQEAPAALPKGWSLDIGETFIGWDGEHGTFNVRVENLGFINAKHQRVISIPDAAFSLHGDSLMRGEAEPRYASIRGMSLILTRSAESGVSLGVGSPDGEEAAPAANRSPADLINDLFGRRDEDGVRRGVLGRLEELSILDTDLTVADETTGRVYHLDETRLLFSAAEVGIDVAVAGRFRTRDFTQPLTANFNYRPRDRTINGTVGFAGLHATALAAAFDLPRAVNGFDFPMSGNVGFQISGAGDLGPMPVRITAAEGTFALPGHLEKPLPVKRLAIEGMLRPSDKVLEINRLSYDSGAFVADASGQVALTTEGPWVSLDIYSEKVPLTLVPAYWPPAQGSNVRQWIAGHIRKGTGHQVSARINLRPELWRKDVPDAESFDIRFDFSDADVKLYAPFDGIAQASGRLHVTGRTLKINGIKGQSGNLAVSDGTVTIDDFNKRAPVLNAAFATQSTIAGAAATIMRGPLKSAVLERKDVSQVGGTMAARVDLTIPIAAATKLTDAKVLANANLARVSIPEQIAGLPVTSDKLALKVDLKGAEIDGTVSVPGARANIQWVEHFTEGVPFFRQVALDGTARSELLVRYMPELSGRIDGEVDLRGAVHFEQSGLVTADIKAELTRASVHAAELHWSKPAGLPGTLNFQLAQRPDGSTGISQMTAKAPDLLVLGDINLGPKGALRSLRLERADLGDNKLSIVARREPDRPLALQIVGDYLDIRPWLKGREAPAQGADGGSRGGATEDLSDRWSDGTTVSIALDRLVIDDGLMFQDAVGELALQQPYPVGNVRGLLNGQAGIRLVTGITGGAWGFTIDSRDAGAIINALGLGKAIRKGQLQVSGTLKGDASLTGVATIEDFSLTETPSFARLFSLASFTGIGETLSGRGMSFTKAEMPFVYRNRRLDFQNARMAGPSVGLTSDGYYRFDTNEIRAVGNLIPAYSLSQVLGAIPLLGAILGGDQGLFGVTYSIEGTAAKPNVSVNPLSALAPGILRRMFLEPVEQGGAGEGRPARPVDDQR